MNLIPYIIRNFKIDHISLLYLAAVVVPILIVQVFSYNDNTEEKRQNLEILIGKQEFFTGNIVANKNYNNSFFVIRDVNVKDSEKEYEWVYGISVKFAHTVPMEYDDQIQHIDLKYNYFKIKESQLSALTKKQFEEILQCPDCMRLERRYGHVDITTSPVKMLD